MIQFDGRFLNYYAFQLSVYVYIYVIVCQVCVYGLNTSRRCCAMLVGSLAFDPLLSLFIFLFFSGPAGYAFFFLIIFPRFPLLTA